MIDYQSKLREAKQIERKLDVQNLQLKNLVQYIRVSASQKPSFIPCGGCMRNSIPVDQAFHRAFKYFTKQQKIGYYHSLVNILSKCLDPKSYVPLQNNQNTKKMSLYFFNDDQGRWQTRLIEMDYRRKKFTFVGEKHQIDLKYYILRNSKKSDRRSLALESTEDLQTPLTIRISNNKSTFEELKDQLQKLIFQATELKYFEVLNRYSKTRSSVKGPTENIRLSKTASKQQNLELSKSVILPESQSKFMRQFKAKAAQSMSKKNQPQMSLSRKQMTPSQLASMKFRLINSLNSTQNLTTKIQRELYLNEIQSSVRRMHVIREQDFCFSLQWFKDILMCPSSFKKWKPTLKSVQSLNNEKDTKLFYQEHQFKQKVVTSYLYKRQIYEVQPGVLYFFDASVEDKRKKNSLNNTIEYVVWKFQKTNNGISVIVQAKILHEPRLANLNCSLTTQFLGQLRKLYQNSNITFLQDSNFHLNTMLFERQYFSQMEQMGIQSQTDFFTILEQQSVRDQSMIEIIDGEIQKVVSENIEDSNLPEKSSRVRNKGQTTRLNFKHPVQPYPKPQMPKLKQPKSKGNCPYWQNQFKFNQKGDMISINQKKIKNQSGVLGQILKKIGLNMMKGESILNVSLPVTIFSNESNLSLLCKSLAYAPRFLQKAAKTKNPIQRMQSIISFATGCTTAYIQMDKPFNPILGETFHCLIDGCPVYGQQISHHPPISAMLMKGRGYTLYGNFEAKVSIGFNTATGSNDGICNISFDQNNIHKKVVKYNYQPGKISGLTFGDRVIHAVEKSCYLDVQNYLYLQLNFGKHEGTTEYCKYLNGIEGQLVQLDHSTDLSKFPNIDKSRIINKYGQFFGRWTEEIYYQEQTIFNSWKEYPYECQKYPYPLESDAFNRKDLILKIQGNIDQSQTAKDELQNNQRNDRKLRKKYTGNEH